MQFLIAVVLGGIGVALVIAGARGNGPGLLTVITGPGLPKPTGASGVAGNGVTDSLPASPLRTPHPVPR